MAAALVTGAAKRPARRPPVQAGAGISGPAKTLYLPQAKTSEAGSKVEGSCELLGQPAASGWQLKAVYEDEDGQVRGACAGEVWRARALCVAHAPTTDALV